MSKIDKISDALFGIKNAVTNLKYALHSVPELKENSKFQNKYKGKRCFIVGNGPSLKMQDLSLLENEYVFTVNQAIRNENFVKMKSNFHFWADANFFIIDENKPEDMELLGTMKSVSQGNENIEVFFPIEQKDFVKKFGLDKSLNVNYFSSALCMTEKYRKKIDFTKAIPMYGTVVQWCIIAAIYMGFSEIYLLGCDNTSLMVTLKSALNVNDDDDYAYHISENLQEIDLGAGYQGPLHAGHQGDALGAGVGPLVKLARQGLHRQQGVEAPGLRKGLVPGHVHLGLGEDDGLGPLEDLPAEALHVVAVEDPHAGQRRDAQKAPEIREQVLRLRRHAGALFHVYTIDHHFPSFIAARARRPMSRRQKALSKWIRSARA